MRTLAMILAPAAICVPASAEVAAEAGGSFQVRNAVEVRASADKSYAALRQVSRWWDPAHTYSGDAAKLSLSPEAGGCFCETWPGGAVRHGEVVLATPPSMLRIAGALGPLQAEGVTGALTFEIRARGEGAEIVQTYAVGGGAPDLASRYAKAVDQVLRTQLERLKRYLETGKPAP